MKRKIIKQTLLLLSLAFLISACYDDKSKEANMEIHRVEIRSAEDGNVLEYKYGTEFVFSPEVSYSGTESNLTYEWSINVSASSTALTSYYVLSTEKELRTVIPNPPTTVPYILVLKVRDTENELEYTSSWHLRVTSGMGEGLVVADFKDGVADLHHIQSSRLTARYSGEDVITRNLYSAINGESINGQVKHLYYGVFINSNRAYENRMYVATEDDFFSLDPATFAINYTADQLFWVSQNNYKVDAIGHGPQNSFYCTIGGKMFLIIRPSSIGGRFSSAENFANESVVMTNMISESSASSVLLGYSGYDETNGQFVFKLSSLNVYALTPVTAPGAFVGNDVKGFECKGSGLGDGRDHLYVLRNKTTGNHALYRLNGDGAGVAVPKSLTDLSSCTGIASAVGYVFCRNQDVFYYATNQKIYAVNLGSGGASVSEQSVLNLASGEEITGIQMFYQNWYEMQWDNAAQTAMPENGMQLIVSTYNGSTQEGKIYLVPITALHLGQLGAPVKTFSGFGRITTVRTQQ